MKKPTMVTWAALAVLVVTFIVIAIGLTYYNFNPDTVGIIIMLVTIGNLLLLSYNKE